MKMRKPQARVCIMPICQDYIQKGRRSSNERSFEAPVRRTTLMKQLFAK
jgi:hypothetical protein